MRLRPVGGTIADMSADRISVRLCLEPGSDPLSGWVIARGGQARPFQGWLGLAAALERLLEEGSDPTRRERGRPMTDHDNRHLRSEQSYDSAATHEVPGPGRPLDTDRLSDHVDRLYRAAWALCGSREDAEDLVQETFARVLARPRFVRGGDDVGYLLVALRNTFLSRKRTDGRRPVTAPMPRALRSRRATHVA
jgi:Sigma-70 region 2